MPIARSHIAPFINIRYENKSDLRKTESALSKIDTGQKGNNLIYQLSRLAKNGKTITIVADRNTTTGTVASLTKSQIRKYGVSEHEYNIEHNQIANKLSQKRRFGFKGEGTSALIQWNPSLSVKVNNEGIHNLVNDEKEAFISLAHQLIHSYRMMKGTFLGTESNRYQEGSNSWREQLRAIGLGNYSNHALTENSIRQEHSMNLRTRYNFDRNDSIVGD